MQDIAILAAIVFGYGLVSERLAPTPLSGPMLFTFVGMAIGEAGTGWLDLGIDSEGVRVLAEATLVLILFSDASRIDLRILRREYALPLRLLGVGLPLTIGAGTVAAALIFTDLTWQEAALLAAILSPTDAALGKAVVTHPALPVRVRQGLNVESGLNDGIVLPLVTLFLALAAISEGAVEDTAYWVEFVARQVGFGVLFGLGAGYLGGLLIDRASARGWMEGAFQQLATLAVAAGAFATAELVDGNGFIAAFVAGLAFGSVAREHCGHVQDFTEDEGELLTLLTFTVFGATIIGPRLDELTWEIGLYATVSLTVVRMVPVALAMIGSGAIAETRAFLGWFGPRGLASILFGLLLIEEAGMAQGEEVFTIIAWTVLASIVAHGITAPAWSVRLGRRLADRPASSAELMIVDEMPTRV